MDAHPVRWLIGAAFEPREGDGIVALDLEEMSITGAVGIHEILAGLRVPVAEQVHVEPPRWRGYRFWELLEWLVCAHLGESGRTQVTWQCERRRGATALRRLLERRGWRLDQGPSGRFVRLRGTAPRPGIRPRPRSFTTELGGRLLTFGADWGVFSSGHLDEGTMLLYEFCANEVALGSRRAPLVVDVGTGYGPLAVGLVASGLADRAVASDVDLVAVYLASHNAVTAGVDVEVRAEGDPSRLPSSSVTVCSIPTHVGAGATRGLVRGLASRTEGGPLFVGVHASLTRRYAGLFVDAGTRVEVVARKTHAVLRVSAPGGRPAGRR